MANEPAILPSCLVEIMARLDAGESRSDLLIEFELREASFLEAQRRWLAVIGAAVLRGDFKLQRHYAAEYTVHFERAKEQPSSNHAPASRPNAPHEDLVASAEPPLVATGAPASAKRDVLTPPSAPFSEPPFAEPPFAEPSFAEPSFAEPPLASKIEQQMGSVKTLDPIVEPQFVEPPFVEPRAAMPPAVVSPEFPALVPPAVVRPGVVPPVVPAMVKPPAVVAPPTAPAMVMPAAVNEPPVFRSQQSPSFEPAVVAHSPNQQKAEPAEPPIASPASPAVQSPGGYQRMPAGFGGTVSFSDTGFGIAPVMPGAEHVSPAAPVPSSPLYAPAEPPNAQGSAQAEPQFVPGIAASSGQSRPRPPSLKPLPQHLNFMTGGSAMAAPNSANGMPGVSPGSPAAFGGPPAAFGGPPAAFGGFPPPGAVSPLPPTALAPFSSAAPAAGAGGASPRPAGFGAAPPMGGNWSAPSDFQSPVRGGLPAVPSLASSTNHAAVVATTTNPLSLEQLACIQAELDVDPERLWDLLQANGVNEPSYHTQSAALHHEMVSNPEKARRFEQLREYYRAIFNSPK